MLFFLDTVYFYYCVTLCINVVWCRWELPILVGIRDSATLFADIAQALPIF